MFKDVAVARGNQKIMKKFRGLNYVILVETYKNLKGILMRITKIFNGIIKNIVVPYGRLGWGWKKNFDYLGNLVERGSGT